MAHYADPRVADHAEGLEQRIIALGVRIEHGASHRMSREELRWLRWERRLLLDDLAATSDTLTEPVMAPDAVIHADPVTADTENPSAHRAA